MVGNQTGKTMMVICLQVGGTETTVSTRLTSSSVARTCVDSGPLDFPQRLNTVTLRKLCFCAITQIRDLEPNVDAFGYLKIWSY